MLMNYSRFPECSDGKNSLGNQQLFFCFLVGVGLGIFGCGFNFEGIFMVKNILCFTFNFLGGWDFIGFDG